MTAAIRRLRGLRRGAVTTALVALALALAGSAYVYWLSGFVPEALVDRAQRSSGVWFQADLHRVFENLTMRGSNHYRTKVHPLFSMLAFPPCYVLMKLGVGPLPAVRLVIAGTAGLWFAALSLTFAAMGLRRLDGAVFTVLAALSASVILFAPVPETFLLGSVSILVVVGLTALADRRPVRRRWQTLASAFSLSVTTTNWMAGLQSALVMNGWRRSLAISRDAFLVVTLLWGVQKLVFPTAEYFLAIGEEPQYVLDAATGGPLDRSVSFFLHSLVLPAVQVREGPSSLGWPRFTVQRASLATHGVIGLAAVPVWLALLGVGALAAIRARARRGFFVVLAGTLAGQYLLHLVYGHNTILYSLHWLPLLVLVAAAGTLSPARPWVLVAAGGLAVGIGLNNLDRFAAATGTLRLHAATLAPATQRAALLAAIHRNPDADWPRGLGHVVLGEVGAPLDAKGYHEPGGSFSPGFGSFGMSFALFDPAGAFVASSNSLPLAEIDQALVETGDRGRAAIRTRTRHYDAEWAVAGEGRWRLRFESRRDPGLVPVLRITSAGPAGGRLESWGRNGATVTINDRWHLRFDRPPARIGVAPEGRPPVRPARSDALDFAPDAGFGALSFELAAGRRHVIEVSGPTDARGRAAPEPPGRRLVVSGPDEAFGRSLSAQIAHLKMGLVADETRPGDPGNYPLAWLRDGAYVVVALARAGELGVARRLAAGFATRDFFGGFGAEADAPGLALWALDEAAARVDDRAFDRELWPHVRRKTAIIAEMLDSRVPVHKAFDGPLVPGRRTDRYVDLSEISAGTDRGLILGKMDGHRPVFFVNAVSYLGLVRAAHFAERLGHVHEAAAWRERALAIRRAWRDALPGHADRANRRTLIAGYWPAAIADPRDDVYRRLLEDRWRRARTETGAFRETPEWTYFDVAEAHQWLYLGRPERVWATLRWFWSHQASPGLYTWWEGTGEENTFGLWLSARGWVKPPHVTPHYWTAAEMALLQTEMLAHEWPGAGGGGCGDREIVVGAGVPGEWLSARIDVGGLSLSCGRLDWRWDGTAVTATWRGGPRGRLRLGPAFPPAAEIRVVEAR